MKFLHHAGKVRRAAYVPIATGEKAADGSIEEFGHATCQQWTGWRWRKVSMRTLRVADDRRFSAAWYDMDTGKALSSQVVGFEFGALACAFEDARSSNDMRARFMKAKRIAA